VLVSRPSPAVRTFLGERAGLGALAGLVLLTTLAWAVRQSTRPVTLLAASIRAFSTRFDAPDLAIGGPPELRDLATAYNEMKARIADLIGERTRILAGIAHDLRTYLTRLRLRAEFIDDPDQRARAAADLAEMSLLLDDTLLFAQPASRPALLEPIAIGAELAQLVATRREMGEAVVLDAVPAEWLVSAERLSLRRAIGNLIDNGLRHGTAVTIRVACTARIEIVVTDDGPGVPPEMLARLGQAFDRLDPSRDRSTGGAGLGLAIVRALIDRQGGRVHLTNGPIGGLEAKITLSRAAGCSR
jgi:signal transduction histidine kinase